MDCITSLLGLGIILSALGCGPHPAHAGECTTNSAQAIYGGSPDASSAGLDGVAAAAVAGVVIESDAAGPSLCSGVLIAPRFVLTAAHCGVGAAPGAVHVSFGRSAAPPFGGDDKCTQPVTTYPAEALIRNADADVMLIELATKVPSVGVASIAQTAPLVGQMGVIAGYGLTEQGTVGERLYVGTTVVAVGATVAGYAGFDGEVDSSVCEDAFDADACASSAVPLLITVDSGADAGACAGDSGGPLFVRDATGWKVAGVLSEGSADCAGRDVYVDLSSIAAWIVALAS